jgi:3-isopropylmalate dehydrogenase
MKYRIAWIEGDGIGPEISQVALQVLETLEKKYSIALEIESYQAGDKCKSQHGFALPKETIEGILKADVAIKGPVGETAADVIVRLRQMFDLFANIRPAKNYPNLPSIGNIDLVIVRENTEDLYKGIEFDLDGTALAIRIITEKASRRITAVAARQALSRKKKVTIVHKANVMKKTCGLFSRIAKDELKKYREIQVSEMYVDAASMALIRNPEFFDVIVTTNMFGDILSDEAAQVAGGLGMAASGNIGTSMALFEPVHGSAPDIAGKGIANPYSMVLTTRMMLNWLAERRNDRELAEAAEEIEKACVKALSKNVKTQDLGGRLKTSEVAEQLKDILLGNQ